MVLTAAAAAAAGTATVVAVSVDDSTSLRLALVAVIGIRLTTLTTQLAPSLGGAKGDGAEASANEFAASAVASAGVSAAASAATTASTGTSRSVIETVPLLSVAATPMFCRNVTMRSADATTRNFGSSIERPRELPKLYVRIVTGFGSAVLPPLVAARSLRSLSTTMARVRAQECV